MLADPTAVLDWCALQGPEIWQGSGGPEMVPDLRLLDPDLLELALHAALTREAVARVRREVLGYPD